LFPKTARPTPAAMNNRLDTTMNDQQQFGGDIEGPEDDIVQLDDEIEQLDLRRRDDDDSEVNELDMTPMVDVTFLLLIFFMVTAAFSLHKSIEQPPVDQSENAAEARTIEEVEHDDDYVIVRIYRDDSIFVDDREATSEQELLVQLREARQGSPGGGTTGPSNLLVMADGDCRHETVVMALDAGTEVGMESVRLTTVDSDDL